MNRVIRRHRETRPRTATVSLTRDRLNFVVKQVPVQVCDGCGEEYFDESITQRPLALAESAARSGVQVDARDDVAA